MRSGGWRAGPSRVGVVSAVAFGATMTGLSALILGLWRAINPRGYSFAKSWMEAYAEHQVPSPGRRTEERRRRAATSKLFRERWEREPYPVSAKEFIETHWAEISAAESESRRR